MTGDEHIKESERLLALARNLPTDATGIDSVLAGAQVHATLALAAFTREDHPAGPGPYTGVGL